MRRLSILIVALGLYGCGGATHQEPRTFDLGLEAPGARIPTVHIGSVRAIAPFDTPDMQYRLVYRNATEIATFAHSRWAASPADMFRKQLLRASGDGAGKCSLDVDIQEFSQVFAAKESSEARIELLAANVHGAPNVASNAAEFIAAAASSPGARKTR